MLHGASYSYRNDLGEEVALMTARGLQYGYDYWGNFGLALFTVFQVLTHEWLGFLRAAWVELAVLDELCACQRCVWIPE